MALLEDSLFYPCGLLSDRALSDDHVFVILYGADLCLSQAFTSCRYESTWSAAELSQAGAKGRPGPSLTFYCPSLHVPTWPESQIGSYASRIGRQFPIPRTIFV